jgi:hypothetical protein
MKAVSSLQKHNLKHTIAGFDWARLGEATIVDVRPRLIILIRIPLIICQGRRLNRARLYCPCP